MDKQSLIEEIVRIAKTFESGTGSQLVHLNNVRGARRYVMDASHIKRVLNLNASILDLGCGCGQMAYLLARMGYDVTASDIFPETPYYVRSFNRTQPKVIDYHCCNILRSEQCQLRERRFDAVCLSGVLEHVPNFSLFLVEVKRLLNQDGKLFIFRFPNAGSWIEKIGDIRFGNSTSHPLRFTPKEIAFMLRWHGFKIDEFGYESILPVNMRELSKLLANIYHKSHWIITPLDSTLCTIPLLNKMSTSFRFVCTKARTKS